MVIVGQALVSEDILENYFECQTTRCKGACCVAGDRGAPLQEPETALIREQLEAIKPFMDGDGLLVLAERSFVETDPADNERVTTCRDNGACVFVVFEQGVATCALEKAYYAGKTTFIKPVSCHLYPVRASVYGEYTVFNYHRWDICAPGCEQGIKDKVLLYVFLKEALIRRMGREWFEELLEVAEAWQKKG